MNLFNEGKNAIYWRGGFLSYMWHFDLAYYSKTIHTSIYKVEFECQPCKLNKIKVNW